MKNFSRLILFLLAFGLVHHNLNAQCPFIGSLWGTAAAPSLSGQTVIALNAGSAACNFASSSSGDYVSFTGLTAGNTYVVTSSAASTLPAVANTDELTVYLSTNTTTGNHVGFGTGGVVTFTAASNGTYFFVITPNGSACGTAQSTCRYLSIQCTSCPAPPPPPANDVICGAVSLGVSSGVTCTTSLTGQSTQYATAGATACTGSGADDDVWYSFVATSTSHIVTLTSSGAGSTDRVHQLYSSSDNTCSGTLTSLTCSDPETSTTTGLTIGNTYFLRVHSYSTGNFATYDICITTPPPPPANDLICGAVSLSISSGLTCTTSLTGQSTQYATAGAAACTGSGADDDVWYSFVATSTAHIITLSSSGAGSTDRAHQLYSSSDNTCSGILTSLTCSDPETSTTSGLTIGNTYFLRVHSYSTGNFATYDICITTPPPPPANDECSNSVTLVPQPFAASGCPSATSGTTVAATISTTPTTSFWGTSNDDDVWYTFTTGAGITAQIVRFCNVTYPSGSAVNMALELHASCATTGIVGPTVTITSGAGETTITGLTANTNYKLRVFTSSTSSRANFDISILNPSPVPDCATLNTPTNGATTVAANTPLTWSAPVTGGTPTGYKVYLGTVNPPTTLVSTVAAPTTTYTPTGQAPNTLYYWYIVPTNGTGDAVGCNATVFSYTTAPLTCPANLGAGTVNVASLPYNSGAGQTTCGNGNNITSVTASIVCGDANYYGGEDKTYVFTPTTTASHTILVTTTTDVDAGITLYQGCPLVGQGGTCVGFAQSLSGLTRTIVANLTAGVTYYLVVDNYPTPACVPSYTVNINVTPAVPDCATLNTPTNGATMVVTNTPLTWSAPATGGTPTGYKVYLGTVNPPTTLVSTVAAPTTTYTPTGQAPNTLYYWYVVPTNGTGDAVGCNATVFSYTTAPLTCPANLGAGTVNVASLPYNSGAGQTTCGNGNNITATTASIVCGSSSYYGGEDKTYIFTPTSTNSYTILVTTTTDQDAGITLYQGCPLIGQGGTCVGNAQATTGLTRTIVANLTAGVTYYLVVDNFPSPACLTSYTVDIALSPSMTYTSSAITQQTGTVAAGTSYQKILQLAVVTANAANPLQVTQLDFTTTGTPGTSTPADLTNARVYYTSTTNAFTDGAPSGTQFGTTIVNPSGAMSFVGTQALTTGTNYFWLVYDLACGAVGPNIDASMVTNGLTMTGGPYTPTTPNPANNRTVTALTAFSTVANGSWNTPGTWACGVPPTGTTVPININHNVTLDVDVNVQSTVTVAASRTLTVGANNFTVGGSGTGTQNFVLNGTVLVNGGGSLNVGENTAVTTSNITVASGGTFTLSNGTVNLGPANGGKRTLTTSGTLNITGGNFNVNGNVVLSAGCTFNMSSGTLLIDPNDGTSGGSVGTGTNILAVGSSTSAISSTVTGGTILINDPPFSGAGLSVANNTSTGQNWTGSTIQFGGSTGTNATTATNGFQVDCYINSGRLRLGNVIVNGGSTARRVTDVSFGINVMNDLTVNAGSELRIASTSFSSFAGNIINNGTIITTGAIRLESVSGTSGVATSNVQSISGSGIWQNATSGSTANMVDFLVNNTSGTAIALPANMISGIGTGSVSGTLTLTAGKLDVGATPLILGVSTATTGTLSPTTPTSASYIIGEFQRWVGTTTGNRFFPVGTSSTPRFAQINFTTGQTGGGKISSRFVASTPGVSGLPIPAEAGNGNIVIGAVSPTGYWQIDRLSGTGGTYTAIVDASGFTKTDGSAITDFPNVKLVKRTTAGDWAAGADGTASTIANAAGLATATRTGCTAFSVFAIGGTAAALPIELKSFTGKALKASNQLEWITSTEEGVKEHIIERSDNGYNNWTLVGTTPSKGDARVDQFYSMEDKTPLTKSFYRLRSLDLDGREQFSNVISLTRQNNSFGVIAAYPNPAVEMINVQFNTLEEGNITARIVDMTGRLVLEQQMSALNGTNMFPVQLHGLSAGTYFITLSSDNEVAEPIRFVKQ